MLFAALVFICASAALFIHSQLRPYSLLRRAPLWLAGAGKRVSVLPGGSLDRLGRDRDLKGLSEAFDVIPEGLGFFDNHGRLVTWNAPFAENWKAVGPLKAGRNVRDMVQARISIAGQLVPYGTGEILADRMAEFEDATGCREYQIPDGRWLQVSHRRTASGGTVTMAVDITRLKLAEAAASATRDAAQAADRAKSEFLANMSHEVRTPMNGIMVMNELMLRSPLSPDQRKFAETIQTSAEALLNILNDILEVSKLEAGKVELQSMTFSLECLVQGVVTLMRPRAEEKQLDLSFTLDEGAVRLMRGDSMRIRQVLLNLVGNAVKFTDAGSVQIVVSTRPIEPGVSLAHIEVHDTGIGLTHESRSDLFQTFSQADSSTTRRFDGMGLGLSISRQLVRLMGGDIGVLDGPQGGSIFWFETPLAVLEPRPNQGDPTLI